MCGRKEGKRKVKNSLSSTSENELKPFLVPAAAYNGKNEDWLLPEKRAVRNNRCEVSATSLASSAIQGLRSRGPRRAAAFSEVYSRFEWLNYSSSFVELIQ